MIVSAVQYLNTWPLIWGFLYGPQRGLFRLRFDLPAGCAASLESGEADIGLVPSAELDRQNLKYYPGLGIATEGPVRSILLVSKVPIREIRSLAADSSSRTSVALARILLREKYGVVPRITRESPDLEPMMAQNDAALIIGDPALRVQPETLQYYVLDLGEEWVKWSGLPMVFAVWAGRKDIDGEPFEQSYGWGSAHVDEMVQRAIAERGFAAPLAREYLTRCIHYKLGPKHLEGLGLFRKLSSELMPLTNELRPAGSVL